MTSYNALGVKTYIFDDALVRRNIEIEPDNEKTAEIKRN